MSALDELIWALFHVVERMKGHGWTLVEGILKYLEVAFRCAPY